LEIASVQVVYECVCPWGNAQCTRGEQVVNSCCTACSHTCEIVFISKQCSSLQIPSVQAWKLFAHSSEQSSLQLAHLPISSCGGVVY